MATLPRRGCHTDTPMAANDPNLGLKHRRVIARSLGVPEAAFGLLEQFFEPIDALGSQPDRVVEMLKAGGVGKNARVLDLGCGKGVIALRAAKVLRCACVGVDAFPGFLRTARHRAAQLGVAERCRFRVGLAQDVKGTFDAVVCLNVFPIERAIPLVRQRTKIGGVYIVDDAVLVGKGTGAPRAADVRAWIGELGDRVLRERVETASDVRRREHANFRAIEAGVRQITERTARERKLLRACLAQKRAAIRMLQGPLRPACWLVERGH